MKKQLNEEAIQNELRQSSSYFKKPTSDTKHDNEQEQQKWPVGHSAVRSSGRSAETQQKRPMTRNGFDVFKDQLQRLQLLQFKAVQQGKSKPSIGAMVREALDNYLEHQDV